MARGVKGYHDTGSILMAVYDVGREGAPAASFMTSTNFRDMSALERTDVRTQIVLAMIF